MKNTVAFEGVGEEVGNFGSGKYAYIIKMPCANFPSWSGGRARKESRRKSVYICNRINYHLMVGEEKQKIVRRQKIFITNMIVFEKLPSWWWESRRGNVVSLSGRVFARDIFWEWNVVLWSVAERLYLQRESLRRLALVLRLINFVDRYLDVVDEQIL